MRQSRWDQGAVSWSQYPEVWGRVLRGHGTWQDTCPLWPERLLHTSGYAAVSSTVLGSRSLPAASTGLTQNAGCQTGFFRGLEIIMQHPGIAALTMGTWVTKKTHKHKRIPFREGAPSVFFLVEVGICGVLVMLGCLMSHRPLEVPTQGALGCMTNTLPL